MRTIFKGNQSICSRQRHIGTHELLPSTLSTRPREQGICQEWCRHTDNMTLVLHTCSMQLCANSNVKLHCECTRVHESVCVCVCEFFIWSRDSLCSTSIQFLTDKLFSNHAFLFSLRPSLEAAAAFTSGPGCVNFKAERTKGWWNRNRPRREDRLRLSKSTLPPTVVTMTPETERRHQVRPTQPLVRVSDLTSSTTSIVELL